MVISDKIILRQLAEREWRRPEVGLKRIQALVHISQVLPEIGGSRSWRDEPFKKYFEEFQAVLFCYGLEQVALNLTGVRRDWEYSYGEKSRNGAVGRHDGIVSRGDDCYLRCTLPPEKGGLVYKSLQFKELPPNQLNPHVSLQFLINSLEKYTSDILVVAIYVNRGTTIRFSELTLPKLCIEQLWLYGFTEGDNAFIVGNLLQPGPARHNFVYPRFPFPRSLTGD